MSGATTFSWQRVLDPGFELILPQDEPTRVVLGANPWLQPWAVTADWDLRIGSSATVVQTGGETVVIDPFLAFGGADDQDRRMAALAEAGAAAGDVDVVVNSHIDQLGANLVPGTGAPAFPNARYLIPGGVLDEIREGMHPGAEPFLDVAEAASPSTAIADGVAFVDLPGHARGHFGIELGDPVEAIVVGHLFVHPAQVARPGTPGLDSDTPTATASRLALLARCADEGIALVGPLWAPPGRALVRRDGDGFALEVVES